MLAEKAYPHDSEEIGEHLDMQTFLEGVLDQNARLEIRKKRYFFGGCFKKSRALGCNLQVREFWPRRRL